jgi:DNA-binding HxlR family transcriptional regulator
MGQTRPVADVPRPGRPVRGSRTGQPLNATFDLLGRRWALSVVWSLRLGPVTFVDLQRGLESISSSVLTTRLRELGDAGITATDAAGRYVLTDEGVELCRALQPLLGWSARWSARVGGPERPRGQ